MLLWASRLTVRRTSWIDQQIRYWSSSFSVSFGGVGRIGAVWMTAIMAKARMQRDVMIPATPRAGCIMIEAEFALGSLEAFLNRPAIAVNGNERLDACSGCEPDREDCDFTIANIAPNEETTGPKPPFSRRCIRQRRDRPIRSRIRHKALRLWCRHLRKRHCHASASKS